MKLKLRRIPALIAAPAFFTAIIAIGPLVSAKTKLPTPPGLPSIPGFPTPTSGNTSQSPPTQTPPTQSPSNNNPGQSQIADPVAAVTARYGGELPSVDAFSYVHKLVVTLVAKLPDPGKRTFKVHLLNSAEVNHFSLPDTKDTAKTVHIFVTRGLLERLDDEAQLVAVLTLEMAHANLGHIDKRVQDAKDAAEKQKKDAIMNKIMSGRINAMDVVSMSIAPAFNIQADGTYGAQFTSDEEMEATKSALASMDQASYDPREFYLYLDTVLKALNTPPTAPPAGSARPAPGNNRNPAPGTPAPVKNLLFTHSLTYERAADVKDYIDKQYKDAKDSWVVGTDAYVKNVKQALPTDQAPDNSKTPANAANNPERPGEPVPASYPPR